MDVCCPEPPEAPEEYVPRDFEAEVVEVLFLSGIKMAHGKSPVPTPHWKLGASLNDGSGSKRPAVYLIESKGGSHKLRVKVNVTRSEGISGKGKLTGKLRGRVDVLEFTGECPTTVGVHEVEVTIVKLPDTIEWYRGDVAWGMGIASASASFKLRRASRVELFVVFDKPASFYKKGVWTEALRFLFDKVATGGAARPSEAVARITNYCHGRHGLSYDTRRGAPSYGCGHLGGTFNLEGYLKPTLTVINCYDQAAAVQSLAGTLGVAGAWNFQGMPPKAFGFINETHLIGVGNCNNPFYRFNGSAPVVPVRDPARTAFGNHAFIAVSGSIHDACAGPHTGTETAAQYLIASVDIVETRRRGATPGEAGDIIIGPGVTDVR